MTKASLGYVLRIVITALTASFFAPEAHSASELSIFAKYSPFDKLVYWAGNALAPQAVAQARVARFIPASTVSYDDVEELLETGEATLSIKLKNNHFYVLEVGSESMDKSEVEDTFESMELFWGKEFDTGGYIITSKDYESSALAMKIKKEGIEAVEIISWRPQATTQQKGVHEVTSESAE